MRTGDLLTTPHRPFTETGDCSMSDAEHGELTAAAPAWRAAPPIAVLTDERMCDGRARHHATPQDS